MAKSNRLIYSSSPYLLQHAHNPVDWFEWSTEAFEKAQRENKPLLISIGYSSCHWCHVMEHESFERDDIAEVMNKYFVCIKVDREERPDVDQIYMDAVQAMGLNGGWPLNVFCTPDQKPFYGGTYFHPKQWAQTLQNIHHAFINRRNEIDDSAQELYRHMAANDTSRFISKAEEKNFLDNLNSAYHKIEEKFDKKWGGLAKAPKFVMPSIWLWLLRYQHIKLNTEALNHTVHTLHQMSNGGLYDQLAGGFARYSVDEEWFVPHFEKMLYDNAQLLSLYAEAYTITKEERFKEIILETYRWIKTEMTSKEGGFYSALDADSEGEEGKFYIWTATELKKLLDGDYTVIAAYYQIREEGNWEDHKNILRIAKLKDDFIKANKLNKTDFEKILKESKTKMLQVRNQRIKPGLDDKIITGWNAMTVCGLIDAFKATNEAELLDTAIRNMNFLETNLIDGSTIYRSFKERRSDIYGFLDDYAYMIHAWIKLYQLTFKESYILKAQEFIEYCIKDFYDENDGYFFYTSQHAEKLITRKKEIFDNVIPSSNAIMAQNLHHAGIILDNADWKEMARNMVKGMSKLIKTEPNYMAHWAIVWTELHRQMAEVAFIGEDALTMSREFSKTYLPFSLVMGCQYSSYLPLLQDKQKVSDKTSIYVCVQKACKLPVHQVSEAIGQVQQIIS